MKRISILLVAATSFAVPACTSDDPGTPGGDGSGSGSGSGSAGDEWDQLLGSREYDYNQALKTAALRLVGNLPTMDEVLAVQNAPDNAAKKVAYEALIQNYMSRPEFTRQMVLFWRDTFKMGETAELDQAPAFAAQLAVENRSYLELFTATTGNCPTVNAALNTITPANCAGTGPQAGVITNQGAMKHYFSNFAFRRVRWVQETFDCAKFPVELSGTPQDVGGAAPYIGVWPFASISGLQTGRVNFQDVSAVICANCHQSMNHIAPLFANYDIMGVYRPAISVPTPLDGAPMAQLTDYLPPTETTAWRFGVPAASLTELGAAMAADTDVQKCGVARVWNWALGKTDIVDTLQEVPTETIQAQIDAFAASGFKMKDLIYAVYTADDFVKF
ncbi:MAG: DUF1549 domain-containing protein [Deltaproteobacteria bacterium]|nr:DUF1549 domain-containing protein [Deltaproteobacteria bacterium]